MFPTPFLRVPQDCRPPPPACTQGLGGNSSSTTLNQPTSSDNIFQSSASTLRPGAKRKALLPVMDEEGVLVDGRVWARLGGGAVSAPGVGSSHPRHARRGSDRFPFALPGCAERRVPYPAAQGPSRAPSCAPDCKSPHAARKRHPQGTGLRGVTLQRHRLGRGAPAAEASRPGPSGPKAKCSRHPWRPSPAPTARPRAAAGPIFRRRARAPRTRQRLWGRSTLDGGASRADRVAGH